MLSVKRMARSPLFWAVFAVTAWFSVTFLILPNVNLLRGIFFPEGKLSLRSWEKLLGSKLAMDSLRNSVFLAVVLAVAGNVVGIFLVLVTRYFDVKGSRILWLGYATNLIYGGIVLVSGYKFVYGPTGLVTKLAQQINPGLDPEWFGGAFAVCFVMTLSMTGNHLLFLGSALSKVDYQTIEAAKIMGASEWRILTRIVLPTLKPMIYALTVLLFLGGLGALAAPQLLGGKGFQTITPMILTFANAPTSRDLAATLALVLGAMTVAVLVILNRLEKGGTYFSVSKVPSALQKRKIDNPVANVLVHVAAYALFVIYMTPPLLVVLYSFTDAATIATGEITPSSFTLENYVTVLTDPLASWPFVVSLMYSAGAAAAVIVGIFFIARICQKYRNPVTAGIEYVLHIPWILPGTLIALAMLITFSDPQALVGSQVLSGTVWILGIAYVIGKIPFTFRIMKAAFTGINESLEEAASLMGAKETYILRRIILPLVLPAATAVTALNFNSMLDDYDTAVFLAHPLYQPLGIFIKNATEGEGSADSTALVFVYAVLLMILTGFIMWLVYGKGGDLIRKVRIRNVWTKGGRA
ncbi:iron ABC transporter permease [Falsarthrobacter nasiphocae]|uniref:Iron(III) transport system permease protein n=1 Tax=Falsarthrobacter nasiphocae TaxID=189863 RepID=A0AAE3YGR6_9MICC|nr:iron ABC transporter permease [Falsarthrobacter nasiphocae]MDR6891860.1 iron(III) transport system permease protein [Falsarthrobacter nasiphocae]